jgi:ribosomal-protein-alanine N-acetyltransferase
MGDESRQGEAIEVRSFHYVHDAAQAAKILREAKNATLWTETDLLLLRDLSGASAYVCARPGRVSGIVIGRRVGDEAEILNLAVRGEERRKGLGKSLMQRLLHEYGPSGVSRVFLEVRESNAGAIGFYESLGFHVIGRRKGYYQQPPEDALVMELRLWKSTEAPR